MKAGIRQVGDGLQKLKDMLARGQDKQAAFARVYPMYQKLQAERFETQNASETGSWRDLDPAYAKYKRRRYGGGDRRASKTHAAGAWNSYPGAGSKMLIGTGMLAGAVIGPSKGSKFVSGTQNHKAMFTPTQMVISVEESGTNPDGNSFDYPHFVADIRPFMSFGTQSIEAMKDTVRQFVVEG